MQIRKVKIFNFINFQEATFYLDTHFNVVIGENQTGKSTLLHAMQVATGAFFLGLPYVKRRHIQEDEIRFEINQETKQSHYFTPTIVEAVGSINGNGEFTWRRVISDYGKSASLRNSDIGQIKQIAENYSKSLTTIRNRPMLPVIVFFGVKQLGGNVTRKKRIKKNRVIIKDGYYNALGAQSDEATFTQWFYYYQENLKDNLEFNGTYEAVIEAIETAIPYLKNVSFDNFRLELVADCEIEGQPTKRLPHSLMSDGVKRMLGIVADIAYRCIVLNGFRGSEAVKETKGVVMIDELDMHLHPNWQRVVVANLKKAFPRIQFVVTTHSPFIVQSLESDELINLDFIMDVPPNEMKIDEVATDVMGVDSPYAVQNDQRYDKAKKILKLIESGESTSLIQDEIDEIPDPGLRAFLELNKLSKGK
ncbi:MAG TPA: AAA family ATPase [Pseudosphingobacterium sp.]|nr:AAA family ATPase [Pseudosphingobacterium sp.]